MTMTITELERSLRALRLSGMTATLENRALQVAQQQMDFIEAFSALVQDELDRRRSRLIERRFKLSGLTAFSHRWPDFSAEGRGIDEARRGSEGCLV